MLIPSQRRLLVKQAAKAWNAVESELAKQAILIVGVGGLGVPAACALGARRRRRIGLVDPDPVELSNLARQVIFGEGDSRTAQGRRGGRAPSARLHPELAVETDPGRT